MKKLLSKEWVFDIVVILLVVMLGTLIMLPVLTSFSQWMNTITDIVIGSIEVLIVTSAVKVVLGEKKYRTWQYWLQCIISIIAVTCLFSASRASNIFMCLGLVVLSLVFTAIYAIVHRVFYIPSTWSNEERQQVVWEKMREKASKMKAEDFLKLELGFRTCPTVDGTIEGDLDFSRPWSVVNHEVYGKVALTYNGAIAHGKTEDAQMIQEALVSELKTSNLV